jgi:hypothetical protein
MSDEKFSDRHLKALSKRANKIATIVEIATRSSNDANVRREGARLGEVLQEWLEDIKQLVDAEDVTAAERIASFRARLRLAEKKIEHWQLPQAVLDRAVETAPNTKGGRKRKAA